MFSASARIRTLDPLIKSQLLYQLSYRGATGEGEMIPPLAVAWGVGGVRAAHVPHADHCAAPWQDLYFLPLPHGQGSLRPTAFMAFSESSFFGSAPPVPARSAWSICAC